MLGRACQATFRGWRLACPYTAAQTSGPEKPHVVVCPFGSPRPACVWQARTSSAQRVASLIGEPMHRQVLATRCGWHSVSPGTSRIRHRDKLACAALVPKGNCTTLGGAGPRSWAPASERAKRQPAQPAWRAQKGGVRRRTHAKPDQLGRRHLHACPGRRPGPRARAAHNCTRPAATPSAFGSRNVTNPQSACPPAYAHE